MIRNVRYRFENIVFDMDRDVPRDPQDLVEEVVTLAQSFGGTTDGSQPTIEEDNQENLVKVSWPEVSLKIEAVNKHRYTVVLSSRAPRGGYIVQTQNEPGGAYDRVAQEPVAAPPPPQRPEPQPEPVQEITPEPQQVEPEEPGEVAVEETPEEPTATQDLPPRPQVIQAHLRFLNHAGQPLADQIFIWQPQQGPKQMGTTDGQGIAHFQCFNHIGGHLSLYSVETRTTQQWPVTVGDLSSTETSEGIRKRLYHLGFPSQGEANWDAIAPNTLSAFQQRFALADSGGTIDVPTRNVIARLHQDAQ